MNQKERLDGLLTGFLKERGDAGDFKIPETEEEKRQLLRSLMNVRPPRPLDPALRDLQDAYLAGRCLEKGIVRAEDIPTIYEIGSVHPFAKHLAIWQGDITRLGLDAIVNAANPQMLGCFIPLHSCIDNCIHTYAGVELRLTCAEEMEKLRKQNGEEYEQPTAVPLITPGFNLPADNVIHIVGPDVEEALTGKREAELADCYRNTLDLCRERCLRTVAFPCISTGIFHFPNRRAAAIAVETVTQWMRENPHDVDLVVFNVFRDENRDCYEEELFPGA